MLLSEFWTSQSLIKSLYTQCVESVCAKHDLTRMELDILLFLANNPQFDTASDIIEKKRLTKSHVSTSIRSLEQRGFLSKSYTPSNHKTVHLSLCGAASEAVTDGQAAQQTFLCILFEGFSAEEHKEMQQFFSRMSSNIYTHLNKTNC